MNFSNSVTIITIWVIKFMFYVQSLYATFYTMTW